MAFSSASSRVASGEEAGAAAVGGMSRLSRSGGPRGGPAGDRKNGARVEFHSNRWARDLPPSDGRARLHHRVHAEIGGALHFPHRADWGKRLFRKGGASLPASDLVPVNQGARASRRARSPSRSAGASPSRGLVIHRAWSRNQVGRAHPTREAGMDASVRSRTVGDRSPDSSSRPLSSALSGLRVALVHDWLTGLRGGEKCLEVLCQAFPQATLYTLIHRRGSTSPAIESMAIRTSPLQRVPGVFRYYRHMLPLMPMAAGTWRLKNVDLVVSLSHCVAKSVQPPPGVPHVCYCFTPMRYAWQGRDAYLENWSDRPLRRALARPPPHPPRDWGPATAPPGSPVVGVSETPPARG